MKKINVVLNGLLAMGICLTMVGCGSASERYLSKFDKFVSSVVEDGDEMSEEDWNEAQVKYDEFMSEYEEELSGSFTPEENKEFGRLQGAYAKAVMGMAFNSLDESLQDGAEMMEGYVEGLLEEE